MGKKNFWDTNKKIIRIIFILWLIIYIAFATFMLTTKAPTICKDGMSINPDTKEMIPNGGCEKSPISEIPTLIIYFIIWLCLLLIGIWTLYGLTKKK